MKKEKKRIKEERMKGRVRLDLSEGDVMCDNTNQHSLTRPFDLHCLVYMYLHDLHNSILWTCIVLSPTHCA